MQANKNQPKAIPREDTTLKAFESYFAIFFTCLVTFLLIVLLVSYVAYLFAPKAAWPNRVIMEAKEWVQLIGQNWKVLCLVLLPLFYGPIRHVVERFRKAPGWEMHSEWDYEGTASEEFRTLLASIPRIANLPEEEGE